jgi:hypothetical protein
MGRRSAVLDDTELTAPRRPQWFLRSQQPGPLQDVVKLRNLHQLGPLEANMPGPLNNVTASSMARSLMVCTCYGSPCFLPAQF